MAASGKFKCASRWHEDYESNQANHHDCAGKVSQSIAEFIAQDK
jgi:hypothetical protein